MSSIARFVMQGPRQAALIAVVFAALPLAYWVSAAVVALVFLQRGFNQGFNILLLALLPGIAWYAAQQETTVIMVILGCALMAVILRLTVSLPNALTASLVPGILTVLLLPSLSPKWFDMLQQGADEYLIILVAENPQASLFEPWLLPMLLGGIAALLQLFAVGIVPVLMVPLFIMGISLIHYVVKQRQLSSQWLMFFYISFLFFLPYMYALLILVALMDVVFNFRKYLTSP